PTKFILGDFAVVAATLPDADVVTLDRVVCCYPDAEALLAAAARRTRQLLAISYPRDRWYVRLVIFLENWARKIKGNPFRAFVHSPRGMVFVWESAGSTRDPPRGPLAWPADLYRREPSV